MIPTDASAETSARVRPGRPRRDPSAPWPEFLGVVACIQFIRSIRGQGVSVRKLYDLIDSHGLPAYYDDLRRTRNGGPSIRFRRDEVREYFERQLRRVLPASHT